MDQKAIEADIKNYKIREGPLYKRSKFLKEWRERWVVLTANYLYTFTTKNLDEVTDVIDLKDISDITKNKWQNLQILWMSNCYIIQEIIK